MATIVILEHEFQPALKQDYLIYALAKRWRNWGHSIKVHCGIENAPDADLAILNVDMTVIPEAYQAVAARYSRVINGAVRDVSKRRFSQLLVTRDTDYDGPVIVKTNANSGGKVDRRLQELIASRQDVPETVDLTFLYEYPVYDSVRKVPAKVWRNSGFVVERFIPEQDEHGYYLRHWVFFGDQERSVRYRAAVPVIKSQDLIERLPAEVPDEIRQWRKRLHFDFGKFDYVLHNGQYVLLDVNATPTSPVHGGEEVEAARDVMARGIDMYLKPIEQQADLRRRCGSE